MRKPLLVVSVLGITSEFALAQTPRETPDWTGYYTLATPRELAGAGLEQDFPGEDLNNPIIPHLQPWAKARMEATDGIADDTGQVCLPDGIFRRVWAGLRRTTVGLARQTVMSRRQCIGFAISRRAPVKMFGSTIPKEIRDHLKAKEDRLAVAAI